MFKKIENEYLEVIINEFGAEIFSIKSKKSGIEYLWQGDSKYWDDRSPILFPICGRLFAGKYTYNGIEYEMPIHGIAKINEFTTVLEQVDKLSLMLKSSVETKKHYPFDFEFYVTYALKGNELDTEFNVINKGNDKMMFSFGAHPGFNAPFTDSETFEDYYLEFTSNLLTKLIFSDTCFDTGKTEKFSLENNKLPLKHNLFDNDALFFETNTDTVKLKSTKNNNSIEIAYNDMTCLGLWHKPKSDAPYICIEPWHGIPSDDGKVDDFSTKCQMIKLGKNRSYVNTYKIKIMEE